MVDHESFRPLQAWSNNSVSGNARVHNGNVYNEFVYNFTLEAVRRRSLGLSPGDYIKIPDAIDQAQRMASELESLIRRTVMYSWLKKEIAREAKLCQTLVKSFESHFRSVDHQTRRSLIKIESVVVLLSNTLQILHNLTKLTSNHDRAQSSELMQLTQRLTEQNRAWAMVISILECISEDEACRESELLLLLLDTLLAGNQDLRRRMALLQEQLGLVAERMSLQLGLISSQNSHRTAASDSTARSINLDPVSIAQPYSNNQFVGFSNAYLEEALSDSYVYRRNKQRTESILLRESVPRTFAWSLCNSEFSSMTLMNVEILEILALPITWSELSNEAFASVTEPAPSRLKEPISSSIIAPRSHYERDSFKKPMMSFVGLENGDSHQMDLGSFEDYFSGDVIEVGSKVYVLHRNEARTDNEFELKVGEMLKVIGFPSFGWALGIRTSQKTMEWVSRNSSSAIREDVKAFPLICVCLPQYWKRVYGTVGPRNDIDLPPSPREALQQQTEDIRPGPSEALQQQTDRESVDFDRYGHVMRASDLAFRL